ncbi:restriction endonuclease subunit S [Mesomycoplasma neurolyticum]|uniref:Restriction endonuclease S subunits n=1 Tax=Mesomycoplasma neurolyticum TaxID=2120 RepID=A0A449A689_9BACT|nr:restriction endonuclease subunit S [Mesomycoplasma neurolyticum]VEU59775.1 Restriction endonuclease S subunits [Mesomycoplasma neurolyticum]
MQWCKRNKGIYDIYSSKTIDEKPITKINEYDFEDYYITIAGSGANCGKFFYRKGKFSIMQSVWLIVNNQTLSLTNIFIFYLEIKKRWAVLVRE